MHLRTVLVPCFFLLIASGCTAKYQDLLRDRDAQIRELNGQLADMRAANADLEHQSELAKKRVGSLESKLSAKPVEAASSKRIDRVRRDLPELDVRFEKGRLSIGIESTVTFASGSITLKRSAGVVLKKVAAVLRRDFGGRRIYVEGHTDSDPIRRTKGRFRSNRHLSAERADVVAAYLVKQGRIPADHVVVVGYGPYQPRAKGSSVAAKRRNRRVEIVVGEPM